jgi:UDP-N-acetylglucosamine--N-acetylmuramyl-(pentapeptide) pyrophosphoryl-undecaprenol N-acetylglucosamine transferase
MKAADLIISRAGAGAIFEIAAFGKASILIPLESAAGDHQTKNAYSYANTGAAEVIESTNLLPNIFIRKVTEIITDERRRTTMENAAKTFYKADAASQLAKIILQLKRT